MSKKYIPGKKYLYTPDNIILIFEAEEKDYLIFNCDKCGKEINHIYFFRDEIDASWHFGSECVKKVIKEMQ